MKTEVYKCRFTGKIFEKKDKKEYINHLSSIRKEKKTRRMKRNIEREFDIWITEEKMKISHVDMIVPWMLSKQKELMEWHNKLDCYSKSIFNGKFYLDTDTLCISNIDVNYQDSVSNSHACPANGVTNFMGDANLPRGYPGFYGSIKGYLVRHRSHMSDYPTSSLLKMIGLRTGSGGGGNESWYYSLSVFIADWPGLIQQWTDMEFDKACQRHEQEKDNIISRLRNIGKR